MYNLRAKIVLHIFYIHKNCGQKCLKKNTAQKSYHLKLKTHSLKDFIGNQFTCTYMYELTQHFRPKYHTLNTETATVLENIYHCNTFYM